MNGGATIGARLNRVGGIVRQDNLTVTADAGYAYRKACGGLERRRAAPSLAKVRSDHLACAYLRLLLRYPVRRSQVHRPVGERKLSPIRPRVVAILRSRYSRRSGNLGESLSSIHSFRYR